MMHIACVEVFSAPSSALWVLVQLDPGCPCSAVTSKTPLPSSTGLWVLGSLSLPYGSWRLNSGQQASPTESYHLPLSLGPGVPILQLSVAFFQTLAIYDSGHSGLLPPPSVRTPIPPRTLPEIFFPLICSNLTKRVNNGFLPALPTEHASFGLTLIEEKRKGLEQ